MKKIIAYLVLFLFPLFSLTIKGQQSGRIVYRSLLIENNMKPIYEELIFDYNQASFSLIEREKPGRTAVDERTGAVTLFIERPDSIHPVIFINNADRTILSIKYLTYDNGETFQRYLVWEGFEINWEITNQTKEISGHNSRAAKADFRGRSYTAWFTTDIPVAFGPWKFQGLPGLVLLVTDSEGEVTFTVEKIQIPTRQSVKKTENIKLQTPIKYEEFCRRKKIARDMTNDRILKMLRARLPRNAIIESRSDTGPITIERDCW